MGLRNKAEKYKSKEEEKKYFSFEFDVFSFITELLSDNNTDIQVKTILISFMSKFNVNKILINFLNEKDNIFKLLGYKGINEENKGDFDFDYHDYFLKALKGPVKISELIKEVKYKNELNKLVSNDFKIIFPMLYRRELRGFITLGNKMNNTELTREDIELVRKITHVTAAVLHNTNSYQDTYQRLEDIENDQKMYLSLFEGIKNINLAENLDEAITIFYLTIKDAYKIQTANIMFRDQESDSYKCIKSIGLTEETDENFIIQKSEVTFNNIMELGESMSIFNFQELDCYKNGISEQDKEKIRIFYCVPIKLGNTGYGFFNIFNIDNKNISEFSRVQERVFSFLPLGLLPYIINKSK